MLGFAIVDDRVSKTKITIPHSERAKHLVIRGRTGTGKTCACLQATLQDITARHGFLLIDNQGDSTPVVLAAIAEAERETRCDLSSRLIVIDPSDPDFSVGMNFLEQKNGHQSFVQIVEFTEILKRRFHLETLGARTEECLRNSLHLIAENNLTIVELAPLLTNPAFRAALIKNCTNADVRAYFTDRYDQASEAMQQTVRDPVLNKVSILTSDPHFRHMLGQSSTFSLQDAVDQGFWIILNIPKGRLGEHTATVAALFLARLKSTLFARQSRKLFTLYCDEIQNLVAYDSGMEIFFSELRKFGVGIISANQYLDQYPPSMRAAMDAAGNHIFFQLSAPDANHVAQDLDGGKPLSELLKNLPPRHFVVKSGHHGWRRGVVPNLRIPKADYTDLYNRCRKRWARSRAEIEAEIRARVPQGKNHLEVLNGWE